MFNLSITKATSAPKRNPSAFLLYCARNRNILREKYPDVKNKDIIIMLGRNWRSMTALEKEPYVNQEARERVLYMQRVAEWKKAQGHKKEGLFHPVSPPTNRTKSTSPRRQQNVKKNSENQIANKESSSFSSLRCSDGTMKTMVENRNIFRAQKNDVELLLPNHLINTAPLITNKKQTTPAEDSAVVRANENDLLLNSIEEISLLSKGVVSLLHHHPESSRKYYSDSTSYVQFSYKYPANRNETNLILGVDIVEEVSPYALFQEYFSSKHGIWYREDFISTS